MTYGIKITNGNNQIIVSDQTTTFYYYGPAEIISTVGKELWGGVTVRLFYTATTKPIIPFIKPRANKLSAITRVFRDANSYWVIEVATQGAFSEPPEVFIFTTADAENWNARFALGNRAYGIIVKRADGASAFDSTVGQPLAIGGAVTAVNPPYDPNPGGQDLTATSYTDFVLPSGITDPMIGYYNMGMSEREFTVNQTRRDCTGIGYGGVCIGFTDVTVQSDLYWAFYRTAVGIVNGNLRCGWLTYSYGQKTFTQTSSSFSFFIPIISLGGGSYTSGLGPFVNQTINFVADTVLVVDKALYPGTNYTFVPPLPNAPEALTVITDRVNFVTNLQAAWRNASNYPVAYSYNVYYRRTGDQNWTYSQNTFNTVWGIENIDWRTDTPLGATLFPGQTIYSYSSPNYLQSANGAYRLVVQGDGNVVLYRMSDLAVMWASGTAGNGSIRLTLQTDGNVVVYRNSDNVAIAATNTFNGTVSPVERFVVQQDGNWVVWRANDTYAAALFTPVIHEFVYTSYQVKVCSVNVLGQEGGCIVDTSEVYYDPPPITGGPDYSGGDGVGGDSGAGTGDGGGAGSGDGVALGQAMAALPGTEALLVMAAQVAQVAQVVIAEAVGAVAEAVTAATVAAQAAAIVVMVNLKEDL